MGIDVDRAVGCFLVTASAAIAVLTIALVVVLIGRLLS